MATMAQPVTFTEDGSFKVPFRNSDNANGFHAFRFGMQSWGKGGGSGTAILRKATGRPITVQTRLYLSDDIGLEYITGAKKWTGG